MILFYGAHNHFGFFSNFSPHPITVQGVRYGTVEHYYQAEKAVDPADAEAIRKSGSPGKAKRLGNQIEMRPDWDKPDPNPEHVIERVKDRVMYIGVLAKFTQHDYLKDRLIETENSQLIEAADGDAYWGWGPDQKGLNKLGQILMRLRDYEFAPGGVESAKAARAVTGE